METKANYVLIGAFTITGFLGLMLFLMWFAKLEVDRQFAYYDVFFPDVTGLSVSAEVDYAGLTVGRVVDMQLSDDPNGAVRVRIEVEEDTPVRIDSRASLEVQGVTGVSNVSVTAGSANAPLLRVANTDGIPVIAADRSALQTLSDQGPQMIERLNKVAGQLGELLNEGNQTRVRNILSNVERSSANLDKALADVSKATDAIGVAAEGIAAFGGKLDSLSASAETTLASADTTLKKFTETAGNADKTLASGTAALDELRAYVAGDLKSLTTNLDQTATVLRDDLPRLTSRIGTTLDNLDPVIEVAKGALGSAGRAFEGADRIINTEVGPVAADLRVTLGKANDAIDQIVSDIPAISQHISNAAESADRAFGSLREMLEGARSHVVAFSRDGLPQYSRLAGDLRSVAENFNALVTSLRQNPSRILSGPKAPEFRR